MFSIGKSKLAEALDSSSGIPTDVTFKVQDGKGGVQEVKGHKYFLALVSDVFKTRFFGSLKETSDILDIQGTTPQAFEAMINFIYHKDCQWNKKSAEELFEIANVAEMYDIAGLMVEVKRAVRRIPVTLSKVAELAHTAEQFSMFPNISTSLLRSCVNFLYRILPTNFLDFSGLIFSPHHESIVLKLHNHLIEKPLPWCSSCKTWLVFDELHVCGFTLPPELRHISSLRHRPRPPLCPECIQCSVHNVDDKEEKEDKKDFLWNY